MKTVFRIGKVSSKVNVDDDGLLQGVEFNLEDVVQENEISVAEIPELGKYLITHSKEAREMIKLIRTEATELARDIKNILNGEEDQTEREGFLSGEIARLNIELNQLKERLTYK